MIPIDLFLASNSPRRRELLEQVGVRYATVSVEVDESPLAGEAAEALVQRLALAKAEAGLAMRPDGHQEPVLGADTLVVLDNEPLGKPRDRDAALAMLARLSGRSHQVMTAVALVTDNCREVVLQESRVRFREIAAEERAAYWASGEPADKAGSYGIQGHGALFVEYLEGSYSGVMGLPLFETAQLLARFGINLLASER